MERGWGISAAAAGLTLDEFACALVRGEPGPEPAKASVPASFPKSRRVTFVMKSLLPSSL